MYAKVKISDLGSNMDEYLAHSGTKGMVWKGHKYVEKKMVNGKWRYYYKTKKNDKPDRETDDEAWVYSGKDNEGNNVFELISVSENQSDFDASHDPNADFGTTTKKVTKTVNKKKKTKTVTTKNVGSYKTRNPNKLYNSAISKHDYYLAHHGIAGQKWGEQNGPPYPLDASDHSAAEKKKDYQDDAYAKREGKSPSGRDQKSVYKSIKKVGKWEKHRKWYGEKYRSKKDEENENSKKEIGKKALDSLDPKTRKEFLKARKDYQQLGAKGDEEEYDAYRAWSNKNHKLAEEHFSKRDKYYSQADKAYDKYEKIERKLTTDSLGKEALRFVKYLNSAMDNENYHYDKK